MTTSTSSTRRFRRPALGPVVLAALAIAAAACVPPPVDPGPTTGATLTTGDATTDVAPGSVITVVGEGYNPAANIGTRPPLWNQPAGVYVVFACVTDPWKPSQGGVGANRQIIQQFWAVPGQEQFNTIGGAGAGAILMDAEGGFSVDITLTQATCAGRYAVITYPGSGAVANPGEELEIPITFATPV
ncbi:hypothetical protein [Dermatobacter hominis]|uniref:hypothetical protein n=1 Tax=Dermatobacter hominis TaxID=2884263 RepID=UPI001D1000E0|nr:hypothetical protein [Dermatobacter hominis]UDY35926.1 hypothetical protein LH044_21735 [Dermatobacter hominis]